MVSYKYTVGLKLLYNFGEDPVGTYNNGLNCGRFVKVTLGGSDRYTGKSFVALVTDSMVGDSLKNYAINLSK